MEIVLVDTSFLFAYYNSEDKHHDSARNYFETISKAWTKFCGYLDKQWSFTDCTSMVFMEENGDSTIPAHQLIS